MLMSFNRNKLLKATFCLGHLIFILVNFFPTFAHSVSFNITQFHPSSNDILYDGDAMANLGEIQLNTLQIASLCWACNLCRGLICAFGSLTDFTTPFAFIIDYPNNSLFSDGFAFFLGPVGNPVPPNSAGGYLGLFNNTTYNAVSQNQTVAVEFDTWSNQAWDPPGSPRRHQFESNQGNC